MNNVPLPQAPAPGSDVIGTATLSQGSETTFKGAVDESLFYPATLADMKGLERPDKFKGGTRRVCCWLFSIDGRESEGVIAKETSFSLSPKGGFTPMCEALGKPTPAPGQDVARAAYLGAKCKILLETKRSDDGQRTFINIAKVVKA